jgi:hypothetical protein
MVRFGEWVQGACIARIRLGTIRILVLPPQETSTWGMYVLARCKVAHCLGRPETNHQYGVGKVADHVSRRDHDNDGSDEDLLDEDLEIYVVKAGAHLPPSSPAKNSRTLARDTSLFPRARPGLFIKMLRNARARIS